MSYSHSCRIFFLVGTASSSLDLYSNCLMRPIGQHLKGNLIEMGLIMGAPFPFELNPTLVIPILSNIQIPCHDIFLFTVHLLSMDVV